MPLFDTRQRKTQRLKTLIAFAFASGLLIGIACGGDGNVVERFTVEGAGMEPTFLSLTDLEVIDYGDASPQNGDVIVFYSPINISRNFIKRIIAIPGDKVEFNADGEVLVNGEVIKEPYVQGATTCAEHPRQLESSPAAEVPLDSLSAGDPELEPAPQGSPPLAPGDSLCNRTVSDGAYFVMGDNRQNSADSRHGWLVPGENIIGWVEEP